jgi:hypothetical protein
MVSDLQELLESVSKFVDQLDNNNAVESWRIESAG